MGGQPISERYANPGYGTSFLRNQEQVKKVIGETSRKMVLRASEHILKTLKQDYVRQYAYMSDADFAKARQARIEMAIANRENDEGGKKKGKPRTRKPKKYERTWEFLNSWLNTRPVKTGDTYSAQVKYYPVYTMKENPPKWQHYSNMEDHKGSSKYTLADMLNISGSTSWLNWNYRQVAYWDAFKARYNAIAKNAFALAAKEFIKGGTSKGLTSQGGTSVNRKK